MEVEVGIKNRQIIGGINKIVDFIYQNCKVILTTSPSFVRRIEERTAAWDSNNASKVKYWPQYAEEFYVPAEKKPLEDLPELEKALEERNVKDMFWMLGRKALEQILQYLAHCDAAFISFAENPLFSMTISAKLQSYMACGMPVLAVAD